MLRLIATCDRTNCSSREFLPYLTDKRKILRLLKDKLWHIRRSKIYCSENCAYEAVREAKKIPKGKKGG